MGIHFQEVYLLNTLPKLINPKEMTQLSFNVKKNFCQAVDKDARH